MCETVAIFDDLVGAETAWETPFEACEVPAIVAWPFVLGVAVFLSFFDSATTLRLREMARCSCVLTTKYEPRR